tara:strand:- start:187 stop:1221 length:1035 start_codon:yes stop_codon:yes gene_type:complete
MNIIIETGHPGHVHQFRKIIDRLILKKHNVLVVAKRKESTIDLLEKFGITHQIIGDNYKSMILKLYSLIYSVFKLLIICRNFNPDLFISRVSPTTAYASLLRSTPHIAFNDTEHCTLTDKLAMSFCDKIATPVSFKANLGKKHLRFNSFTEMFYILDFKNRLSSGSSDTLGIEEGKKISLLRFVSWSAAHDIGFSGLSLREKYLLAKSLSKFSKVLISSESELPNILKPYSLDIHPSEFHKVLDLSSLYVGDGATTASEAALLGVPSVYTNPIKLGYIDELEKNKLVFQEANFTNILKRSLKILKEDYKKETQVTSSKLISNLEDTTEFSLDLIKKTFNNEFKK